MEKKQYGGVSVNDLHQALYGNFNLLVDDILSYESDTFSSEGSKLTVGEAERVALAIVADDLQKRYNDSLDGVVISEMLETVREAK